MSLEIHNVQPFEVTKTRTRFFALFAVALGLFLLVLSNVSAWKDMTFLGGNVASLLGNFGFAAVTLAAFQILYDTQQREVFFREVRHEIAGSESVRSAGIAHITPDSKRLDFTRLVKMSSCIEVGVAYSDRFVKDYNSILIGRPGLLLRYFIADTEDENLVSSLAFMTRRSTEHVTRSAELLREFLTQIAASGTKVEIVKVTSISHYSFVRFDGHRTFLNLSTFASRRADVPSFDIPYEGFLHRFIADDIECLLKANPCPPISEKPSKSFSWSTLLELLKRS